jgi:alpha/beta superfamily hydrolase
VAAFLASKRKISGLLLITPFDSLSTLASEKYPYLPIKFLLKHKFATSSYLKKTKCKVGVIEAEKDEVIPFSSRLRVINAIEYLKFRKILKNTTHFGILTHPFFREKLTDCLNF